MTSRLAKVVPTAVAASDVVTAESLGRQLRAELPPLRLHSISLYDAQGDVLWLSEGALGPDEHNVVLAAIETLNANTAKHYHETGLDDGRFAMFLSVRAPKGDLVGLAMLLTDHKSLPSGVPEDLIGPRVRATLQKIAVFLRVGSTRAGEAMPTPAFIVPSTTTSARAVVSPQIDEILTLELVWDAPSASAAAADMAADLTLFVQELIKLRSQGRTRRYEVLARSRRDADRDEVPAAFVADSAQGREGAALDTLVVQQLLAWLGNHRSVLEAEPASFSINVSIGTLEDAGFLDGVAAALKATGMPPECLGFEIPEFACVQCRPQVERFMAGCERLGCFVVLDNFTFDSAARSLLASKALRIVKIDAKLSAAAMQEKLSQAVVIAIAQACKVLGIHCIAKRVETQAALEWLTGVGCDFAQGFALERPLSLESLAAPPAAPPAALPKSSGTRKRAN